MSDEYSADSFAASVKRAIGRRVPREEHGFVSSAIDTLVECYRAEAAGRLARFLDKTESPIERVMGAALAAVFGIRIPVALQGDLYVNPSPQDGDRKTPEDEPVSWARIDAQATVGDFRADFLIIYRVTGMDGPYKQITMAVECDGHDFHEKTKEQASRDKARDRAFQAAGHRVFRFSGTDIYRDPGVCAAQCYDLLFEDGERHVEHHIREKYKMQFQATGDRRLLEHPPPWADRDTWEASLMEPLDSANYGD